MQWSRLLSYKRSSGTSNDNPDILRTSFEQDYDRIIFSNPFRNLQDKTQVLPLPRHDFVHTRLTHSLEVSSVARSLGKITGTEILKRHPHLFAENITPEVFASITSSAALAHDLGNPPFGHAGESAISEFFNQKKQEITIKNEVNEREWEDLIHFEGNAQGFRVLNMANHQGLRLTFATLGAYSKYPCESLFVRRDPQRKSQKKFGFFQCSREHFANMAEETGLIQLGKENEYCWVRHPLSFLVEAADDICYGIIDLEDATNLGLVHFEETKNLLAGIIGERFDEKRLSSIANVKEKSGLLRALAIGRLINECAEVFLENESGILNGTFDKALTQLIPSAKWLSEISQLSVEKIYRSKPVLDREIAGFTVLNGLLEAFVPAVIRQALEPGKGSWREETLIRLLPEEVKMALVSKEHLPIYDAIRLCLDFISSITDTYALNLYRNITGISLQGI
ncbi:MAG: deoxyguanosinetriphosphate triphosphohydrolase [Cyclobacteriaceae bacterium]|nr:deoxyguanosinetriphosphate triphosphohydrolase [Cyclobacteriaceae bacterium]